MRHYQYWHVHVILSKDQESESFSVSCLEFAGIFFPFQQVFLIVGETFKSAIFSSWNL